MVRSFALVMALCLAGAAPGYSQGAAPVDPALAAAKAANDAGDLTGAIALYEDAAAAGQSRAESELARIYLEGGPGLPADYAAAQDWARKAVDDGDSRGYLYLGQIYMKGLGVPVDLEQARAYFLEGEAAGDLKAPRYLGLIAQAQGDPATAARWFSQGAEAGDITSQFYLGQAYETGAGVPQDYGLAMQWYRVAATRGDLIASDGMVGAAGLYARGLGVGQDLDAARALYAQAAALGNTTAQAALADLAAASPDN